MFELLRVDKCRATHKLICGVVPTKKLFMWKEIKSELHYVYWYMYIYATNNESMSKNGWTLLRYMYMYIEQGRAIVKDRYCAHWHVRYHLGRPYSAVHAVNCTQRVFTHAQYDRFHTGRRSINNGLFHVRSVLHCRFHAKTSTSIRFCRRSQCLRKFLKECRTLVLWCPFTRSSFCNISQTLRKFLKECFFWSCEKGFMLAEVFS